MLQWTVDAMLMTEVTLVTVIIEYLANSVAAALFLYVVLESMAYRRISGLTFL